MYLHNKTLFRVLTNSQIQTLVLLSLPIYSPYFISAKVKRINPSTYQK